VAYRRAKSPPRKIPAGTETVLLTEDEQDVREIAREFLEIRRLQGDRKRKTARKAIAIAAEHRGKIDLLVTDRGMPGMTGQETRRATSTRASGRLRCLHVRLQRARPPRKWPMPNPSVRLIDQAVSAAAPSFALLRENPPGPQKILRTFPVAQALLLCSWIS